MHKLKPSIPKEPVKLRVLKGDTVEVISGKDKGKRGEVIEAFPKLNKIKVKGVNIVIRHRKERPMRSSALSAQPENIPGGRIELESALHTSKVMVVCTSCKRPTRVGYEFKEGTEKLSRRKYRVCKHPDCGKTIG